MLVLFLCVCTCLCKQKKLFFFCWELTLAKIEKIKPGIGAWVSCIVTVIAKESTHENDGNDIVYLSVVKNKWVNFFDVYVFLITIENEHWKVRQFHKKTKINKTNRNLYSNSYMIHHYLTLNNRKELHVGQLINCCLKISTKTHNENNTQKCTPKYPKNHNKKQLQSHHFFEHTKNIFVNCFNIQFLPPLT